LLELGSRFSATVTGADVTRGKPDPQVFLLAAERLGVPPAACAVIEDAVHGITAANRAGMTSIGLTGTATRDRLEHAQLIVDSLRELSPTRIRELAALRSRS
jgi:beta-phosphoglucomutase-like phosphatase (HAD superfamily)